MGTPGTQLSPRASPAVGALSKTLDSLYRISIPDGRIFTGQFVCIDPQGNIVLDRTVELAPEPGSVPRDIGIVMVPKRYWVTVERDVRGDGVNAVLEEEEKTCLAA
ncbi:hypothetical protein P7C70_g4678, partial [Phenoliferia sp. Uapishka_3]